MTEHEHEWQVADTWNVKDDIGYSEDGTPYVKNHIRKSLWLCECGAEKTIKHD